MKHSLVFVFVFLGCGSSDSTPNDQPSASADAQGTEIPSTSDVGDGSSDSADPTGTTTTDSNSGSTETSEPPGGDQQGDETAAPIDRCQDVLRVTTFNIRDVGQPGSTEFQGIVATLGRIGPDIACFQEVGEFENNRLEAAADEAGYPFVIQAQESPAIGGPIVNACIGRVPLVLLGSLTGSDISDDPNANDVGRDILAIRAQPGPDCSVSLFTVHLKAGGTYEDRFRRQVEIERLTQAIDQRREPGEASVVLGDFNTRRDDDSLGETLSALPNDLPQSYRLGRDIGLPLQYDPFRRLADLGFTLAEVTQEDSDDPATFQDGRQLDYLWVLDATIVDGEVYNSCADNGQDDGEPGGVLPKPGVPLSCGSSEATSDHYPVVADIQL